jgi:hypothetical protein
MLYVAAGGVDWGGDGEEIGKERGGREGGSEGRRNKATLCTNVISAIYSDNKQPTQN